MNTLLARLLLAAVALLAALPWFGYMAGDTVIHLIFAENAANGLWFHFNPGTPSGGESSPLYLLYVTMLYKVFGPALVPYALVYACLAAWLLLAQQVYDLSRSLGLRAGVALACALAVAAMPGSVRNAVLGMENIYLAVFLLAWLQAAVRTRWLQEAQKPATELGFGLAAGLMACLRAEAVVFIAIFYLLRWAMLWRRGERQPSVWVSGMSGAVVAMLLFLLQLFWYWQASGGQLPFGGGLARQVLAAQEAWFTLGPVAFNGKILVRLAAYFPLSFMSLVGIWVAWRRGGWWLAFSLVVLAMVPLFATVLPSGHLGRYTIFLWPLLACLAGLGWQSVLAPRLGRYAVWVGAGALCMLGAIYMVENVVRFKTLAAGHPLAEIAVAPAQRKAYTDHKLALWGLENRQRVNVAIVEVQMRYFMDERIFILSLDGIVDGGLRAYVHDGVYDHIAYLRDRQADIVAEFPNFNADANAWALADLSRLKPGGYMAVEDLVFSKLPDGAVRVVRADAAETF